MAYSDKMDNCTINIVLVGSSGNMGQNVIAQAKNFANVNLICVDPNNKTGYTSLSAVKERVDAVLDYSHFSALDGILDFVQKKTCPLIIATTGYSENQLEKIEKSAKTVPIFKASNFSTAVNKFMDAVANFSKSWDGDIEIIETHHIKKADAPSGTAITIAQKIVAARGKGKVVMYRTHENAKRTKDDVYISAVRGGVVPGTHEVRFFSDTCEVSMKEVEYGRSSFAKGAIEACVWMKNKKAVGKVYSMNDMLK